MVNRAFNIIRHRRRQRNNHRRERVFRPRINMDELYFVQRFRLTVNEVMHLVHTISIYLQHQTARNYALTPVQQVLIALRFFAEGSSLRVLGDAHGVSPATVHRCIYRVVEVVNTNYFNQIIQFPENINNLPRLFQLKTQSLMPNVCGIVDGTHVNIRAPHQNSERFINRHDRYSINVMLVCGPDLKVKNTIIFNSIIHLSI